MDYRTRVEEAQLPDDVHKAALCEIGRLEQITDPSPESDEIRAWLDTILNLPWSTKITDSIDIQGSRDVEATLRKLIESAATGVEEADTGEVEPAVAGVEEVDTGEVEPAVAGVEEVDTGEVEPAATDVEGPDLAPAGRDDDDTVRIPGLPAALDEGQHLRTGLPEEQVARPEPVQIPAQKRRLGFLALAAITVIALLITALLFAASRDGDVVAQFVSSVTPAATATPTKPTSELSQESTNTEGGEPTIWLSDWAHSARAFETVRIRGKYPGGAETFLRVQRWEGDKWIAFPVPTKTDQSGKFTTYVEFEQPGRYKLRVLHPGTGVRSKTFVVVIKG